MNMDRRKYLNILFLYDQYSVLTNTVKEYIESFSLFSVHNIFYAHATNNAKCNFNLELFDVVIIHYSVRLCFDLLSPHYREPLQNFNGFKVLFIQDEYDYTEITRTWIENLGIKAVFSCVPEQYLDLVYPKSRFPDVIFISIITGFIPIEFENKTTFKPLKERELAINYRGRELAYWYGNLGREKLLIAQKMHQICEEKNINSDIEWDDEKRIYGEQWYDFMENCRATLGTESGSNVFDDYGNIRKNIQIALQKNPSLTYEEIHQQYLAEHEGKVMMNQISPRIFEAISLKTALILFEGNYSGIVKPELHYIPLKKDFSNIDDVLNKLQNDDYLIQLTERAYQDIIRSGQYSYRKFIQDFDQVINECVPIGKGVSPFTIHEAENRQKNTIQEIQYEIQYKLSEIIDMLLISIKEKIKAKIQSKFPRLWRWLKKLKQQRLAKI